MTSSVPSAFALSWLAACQVSQQALPEATGRSGPNSASGVREESNRDAKRTGGFYFSDYLVEGGAMKLIHCPLFDENVMTEDECSERAGVICVFDVNTREWENSPTVCGWTECYDGSSSGLCDCDARPCGGGGGYSMSYGAIDAEPWT